MANEYANFGGQMCTTLLTMFSFFFFFLERENREIFIYFRRIHRCRVGGEAMKFENRWTRNDGHIYDLCVSLGGRIGRASYCTNRPPYHLAVYCTLLYTVCYPLLERIYVAFRGDEWINPREFRIINRNLISYIEIVYLYLGCYLSCCFV